MELSYRLSRAHDIAHLAEDLRLEDQAELLASSGLRPLLALTLSFEFSDKCFTIINEHDEVCGMYGVVREQSSPSVGKIWMLASPKILTAKKSFIRQCRQCIDDLQADYDLLYNYVDERNSVHIRWIEWSGFKIIQRHPAHGVQKLPFLEFVRLKKIDV